MIDFLLGVLCRPDVHRKPSAERGATATEYALLVGMVALVLVTAVGLFGNALVAYFGRLAALVAGLP